MNHTPSPPGPESTPRSHANHRAGSGLSWSSAVLDLRHGLRSLRRSTTLAVLGTFILAIGLGAVITLWAVIDDVLLSPLPYPEPERLMSLYGYDRTTGNGRFSASYPDLLDFKREASGVQPLMAWAPRTFPMTGDGGEPLRAQVGVVTHDLLATLGRQPVLGRSFQAQDEVLGAEPVTVISQALWQSRYGGDPQMVGRTLRLGEVPYTVVGVIDSGPALPQNAQLWVPAGIQESAEIRGVHSLNALARLAPGVPREAAETELEAIAQRLSELYPEENRHRGARLVPLLESQVGSVRPQLALLFGSVVLLLLLACANVSGLLLARAAGRGREIATRRALGATRRRVASLLAMESLLIAAAGGALGWLFALGAVAWLRRYGPVDVPRLDTVALDPSAVTVALLTVLATAILSALAPIFTLGTADLQNLRSHGGHNATSRRLRPALVVTQVALAVVLAGGAGLLLRSVQALNQTDPGFEPQGLLAVQLERAVPFISPQWPDTVAFFSQLESRLRGEAGVLAVSSAYQGPTDAGWTSGFTVEGLPEPEEGERPEAVFRPVTPGYFDTVGARLVAGRFLRSADDAQAAGAVVVNESFVRAHLEGLEPLGRKLLRPSWWQPERGDFTIVGVVEDVLFAGVEAGPVPAMYYPHAQQPTPMMSVLLRLDPEATGSTDGTVLDATAVVAALRRHLAELEPELPMGPISWATDELSAGSAQRRFLSVLVSAFATIALLLAAIGLYAVLSTSVRQRRRELGVRRALGASAGQLARGVMARALLLVGLGVTLGTLALALASQSLESLLYRVSPFDATTLTAVVLLLALAAVAAGWWPSRRAAAVDPAEVLRQD
ncbi:MAG: ABC transporter permease [Acidobacteriota bacterium]